MNTKKESKKKSRLEKTKSHINKAPGLTPEQWNAAKERNLIPIQLRFDNLSFSVPIPKKKVPPWKHVDESLLQKEPQTKTILQHITGTVNPGTMLAIMGSSGAGKTTLLNVLAGRAVGIVDGEILLNGNPREKSKTLRNAQAYIMQDDLLLATQTPLEILTFSAKLRIPNSVTDEEKSSKSVDKAPKK